MPFDIQLQVTNGTPSTITGITGPREQDWWIIPNGRSGGAYLELPNAWYLVDGHDVTSVQYRVQVLDGTVDSSLLNDPTGAWGAWSNAPAAIGRMEISALPTAPSAVQIRVERNGQWSDPSTFKRLGTLFFDYDDSIQTWAGCVEEAIPGTVYWGEDNVAGEGGQRVPDDAAAILSGDPGDHFEIVAATDGKRYLVPTAAGVSGWSGGDTYSLGLNGSGATNVSVEILANTAVVRSHEWSISSTSITEYEAYFSRIGDLSGRTLLLRPGLYSPQNMGSNPLRNHWGLDGLTGQFTLKAADVAQPPMVSGLNVVTPPDGGGSRQIVLQDLDFFQPQFAHYQDPGFGNQSQLEVLQIQEDDSASAYEISGCRFRSDYIEGRYGHMVRGNGVDRVEIITSVFSHCSGLDVHDNVYMYCYYPQFYQGCDGLVERNLITHCAADYVNPQPSQRATHGGALIYQNNRHREHMADQSNVHSDAFHIWDNGSYSGLRIQGNIWLTGFEARACPGQVTAFYANQVQTLTADQAVGPSDIGPKSAGTNGKLFVCKTDAATITLTIPQAATLSNLDGFAVCNFGTNGNSVVVTDGSGFSAEVSGSMGKLEFTVKSGAWSTSSPDKSFQGLFNNNGSQDYSDTAWRYNILAGVTALSGVLLNQNGSASDFYCHNNSLLPHLLQIGDDITGDGVIDSRDGDTDTDTFIRVFADGPNVDEFKNVVPMDNASDSSDATTWAWDNHYLGPHAQDSIGRRNAFFAGLAGANEYRPCETFSQAIEQARAKAGSVTAIDHIGAVGPDNADAGFWNFSAGSFNGYPQLEIAQTTPQDGGLQPVGRSVDLWFNYPIEVVNAGSIILTNTTSGLPVAKTIETNGRLLRIVGDTDLLDANAYEVTIGAGAIQAWDDATATFGGLTAGSFAFQANAFAYDNIVVPRNGAGEDLHGFFDGAGVALTQSVRFDSNWLGSPDPYLPGGNATWSIEVAKGTGFSARLLLTVSGSSAIETLTIDDQGATVQTPSGVSGVDYGVEDLGSHWKLWIAHSGTAPTRYFWEINAANSAVNVRRPMLIDAQDGLAPWVSPISAF